MNEYQIYTQVLQKVLYNQFDVSLTLEEIKCILEAKREADVILGSDRAEEYLHGLPTTAKTEVER